MATRWMRWNETTHIFEYSTDGVTFNPLPLNAATITEGTFPPGVLPGGSALLAGANVFTNALPISIESSAPVIQYKETDAAVDGRFWRETVDGGSYKLQRLTDALVATDLISVNRAGQAQIVPSVAGYGLDINAGISGIVRSRITNSAVGAGNAAALNLGNDAATIAEILATSSTYTPASFYVASGLHITNIAAGGVVIAANHASGSISFYSGGSSVSRLSISAGGVVTIPNLSLSAISVSGDIATTAGYVIAALGFKERGRTPVMGEWTSYTPTWAGSTTNPVLGNGQLAGKYMKIGKTVFVQLRMQYGSTTTGGSGYWTFTTPSVAADAALSTTGFQAGSARLFDAGVSSHVAATYFVTTSTIAVVNHGNTGSGVTPTSPFTFANGDSLTANFSYEEA